MKNMYELTEEDRQLVKDIATARNNAKPDNIRVRDSGYHSDNPDRAFPHMLGVAAELAYSRITGKPLDTKIMKHGDRHDFGKVEIKSATWPGKDIELKIKQQEYTKKVPLMYMLARVHKDTLNVEFIGCISRGRFDVLKYARRHKFSDNWCVLGEALDRAFAIDNEGKIVTVPFKEGR